MSKVEAYWCDYAGHLVSDNDAVGVSPMEDLYDKINSYPTIHNNRKAEIHYCLHCYRKHCLIPASVEVDRKKNEADYKLKIKELAFGIRHQTVFNYRQKKRKV